MTESEAKQILLRYRPGLPDAEDPDIIEALALVRRSPELSAWFEAHCVAQLAIGLRMKQIPVPHGLKEQILSERKVKTTTFWPRSPQALGVCLALLAIVAFLALQWIEPRQEPTDEASLGFYRGQMVQTVLRAYAMDLETNNLAAVRSYLTAQKLDMAWTLPRGIEKAAVTGCGVLGWQDRKVAMICFHSDNPLRPGQPTDLFLFVVARDSLHPAPPDATPEFSQVNRLMTATWSVGDKTYLLAADGDEAFLKRFL